ncbi:hypothetical protein ED236_09300 [Pseudomethylobacillus aquaticus]|uniref:Uncharacterized protein n=1 Tax=Pseudomethylobacillus aquaticus TaxID=2676064 RepID=A0A3N0V046_9PROT|nr:hypothetical protein [Pseudomethylobacillus aquaticus]ROH85914.1 hypothetical protein ED236_09300 [Pseudomethylobacillus aquaticus]
MDPLSSLDSIAELIRRKAVTETTAKGQVSGADKSTHTQAQRAPAQKPTPEALKQRIVGLISAIDQDDVRKKHKVVRLFVENVLTWQFGEELRNDPSFSSLVDEVGAAMEGEAGLVDELMRIGEKK